METDFRFFNAWDAFPGRAAGEQFYYPAEASPRRYGEGSTRLVAKTSSLLAQIHDPIPSLKEPSYEEWRWETEWKAQ